MDKMDLESNRLHLANGRSVVLSQTSMSSNADSGSWPAARAAAGSPAPQATAYHSASTPSPPILGACASCLCYCAAHIKRCIPARYAPLLDSAS